MKKVLIFFLISLIPSVLFATKIGVIHLKSVGVEQETADIVANLLAAEISNYGYQGVNPDGMDAAVGRTIACYESGCAAEVGLAAKVDQVAFGSVSRLGEKHIVQISVVNVVTQEMTWSGSLSAKTAEDLDMIAKRLAKSIVEGKKPDETVEVGIITEEEEKKPLRRRVFHTTGIRTGMLQPIGGYANSSTLFGTGALYWYETPNFALEVCFSYAFSGDMSGDQGKAIEATIPEISGLYLFSRNDICPYLGGGLGFGILALEDRYYDSGAEYDVVFNGGGGVVFLRTYDVRFLLDVRYRIHMASIEGFDGPHHGLGLSIGVTYRPKGRMCGGCCL